MRNYDVVIYSRLVGDDMGVWWISPNVIGCSVCASDRRQFPDISLPKQKNKTMF